MFLDGDGELKWKKQKNGVIEVRTPQLHLGYLDHYTMRLSIIVVDYRQNFFILKYFMCENVPNRHNWKRKNRMQPQFRNGEESDTLVCTKLCNYNRMW